MYRVVRSADVHESAAKLAALNKSQVIIEFAVDGTVITANQNFLNAMGYAIEEIRGRHHRMFVEAGERESEAYRLFWERLNRGEYQAAQFKRVRKDGREIWIEASYNPILDLTGKPFKVVKYATDITDQVALLSKLRTLIDQIDSAIDSSSGQAKLAAETVNKTTTTVQTMAAGAEQLATSVQEISSMMSKSNAATDSAHAQTSEADAAIRRLAETSSSMNGIIALIRNIAGQINLLALNAAIESARAGEAGKGFAVVAGEVKSLAQQAASATNQIAQEIEQLQAVSNDVVNALGRISHSIDSVRQYVAATASAVEEQSAVTQEISSGMQTTATTICAINDNMTQILSAVDHVAHAVNDTKAAAKILVR